MHTEAIVPVFVLGFFWWAVVSIVRLAMENSFRKRLIDKGSTVEEIQAMTRNSKPVEPYPNLKWGLVLVGLGAAALLGDLIGRETITVGLMLLFAGIGFLIYFAATKKFTEKP